MEITVAYCENKVIPTSYTLECIPCKHCQLSDNFYLNDEHFPGLCSGIAINMSFKSEHMLFSLQQTLHLGAYQCCKGVTSTSRK